MRKDRIPLISGDEWDWCCKVCRRLYGGGAGVGRRVKQGINRRARRKNKQEMKDGTRPDTW